jgi:hypothetical protein
MLSRAELSREPTVHCASILLSVKTRRLNFAPSVRPPLAERALASRSFERDWDLTPIIRNNFVLRHPPVFFDIAHSRDKRI